MNLKFITDLLGAVNAFDIIGEPSYLTSKKDSEEEIGVIKNEETKRLYHYYSHICKNKIAGMVKKLLKSMKTKSVDSIKKREELEKLVKEIQDVLDIQEIAIIFFNKSLEEEFDLKNCSLIRLARGWRIVKPKCSECEMVISDKEKDVDEVISTFSSKFRDKAKYN